MSGRLTESIIHAPPKTGAFPLPRAGLECVGKCGWRLDSWGYFWLGNGPFCYRCSVDRAKHIDYSSDYNFIEDPYKLAALPEQAHYRYLGEEGRRNSRYTMQRLLGTRATKT